MQQVMNEAIRIQIDEKWNFNLEKHLIEKKYCIN